MRRRGIHKQRKARNTPRNADAKPYHPSDATRRTPRSTRRQAYQPAAARKHAPPRPALPDDDETTNETEDNANNTPTRRHDKQATPRRHKLHRHGGEQHETPRDEKTRRKCPTPRNETTHETPKQDARRDDATATADIPQLVQTGVEQAGTATTLLATTAIAAHTIVRRKRK